MKAREGAAVVGVGAACAVCCATPVLAVVTAIGLGALLSVLAFGAAGLLVVLLVVPITRQRRRRGCADPTAPVPVPTPTSRRR